MARGGLSSDPAKRKQQLANLEAGRRIREERRKAGLPPKHRQTSGSRSANGSAGAPAVVTGKYEEEHGSTTGKTRSRREAGTRQGKPKPERREQGPELGRLERFYGRVLGLVD